MAVLAKHCRLTLGAELDTTGQPCNQLAFTQPTRSGARLASDAACHGGHFVHAASGAAGAGMEAAPVAGIMPACALERAPPSRNTAQGCRCHVVQSRLRSRRLPRPTAAPSCRGGASSLLRLAQPAAPRLPSATTCGDWRQPACSDRPDSSRQRRRLRAERIHRRLKTEPIHDDEPVVPRCACLPKSRPAAEAAPRPVALRPPRPGARRSRSCNPAAHRAAAACFALRHRHEPCVADAVEATALTDRLTSRGSGQPGVGESESPATCPASLLFSATPPLATRLRLPCLSPDAPPAYTALARARRAATRPRGTLARSTTTGSRRPHELDPAMARVRRATRPGGRARRAAAVAADRGARRAARDRDVRRHRAGAAADGLRPQRRHPDERRRHADLLRRRRRPGAELPRLELRLHRRRHRGHRLRRPGAEPQPRRRARRHHRLRRSTSLSAARHATNVRHRSRRRSPGSSRRGRQALRCTGSSR